MQFGYTVEISSHMRSRILFHARQLVETHASGRIEATASIENRLNRERRGLSGEFALATLLGWQWEFRDLPNGDGGIDFRNHGTTIDVKTDLVTAPDDPVLARPSTYRAEVIVYVRQEVRDRWERFRILGWLFSKEVKHLARGSDSVEICVCRLRAAHLGLPPDGQIEWKDPDIVERCRRCGQEY